MRFNRPIRISFFVLLLCQGTFWSLSDAGPGSAAAAESTEESIALYADAANFQTAGAFELAIDGWKKFLKEFPDDDLASKAAHYLGVCYMQKENPDYEAAAKTFAVALTDKEYELREESLANRGWCLYAAAGDGPQRDQEKLRQTIDTFQLLFKENPKSKYLDRAYFYSGEAAYGLGDRAKAVTLYDAFLKLPSAKSSPLRCDALYARGIAEEELERYEKAVASFRQVIDQCAGSELAIDVHLRLGDLMIARRDFAAAVKAFDEVLDTDAGDRDKSYAVFRQAYALVQDGKPAEAAERYDRLQREFPDSPYTASATLASAQSLYRAGEMAAAAERFEQVLAQDNRVAATEAAHWLARIKISQGDASSAAAIADRQIESGIDGDFAIDLRLDLAEALASDPATVSRSIEVAESVYRDAPEDPLAPRALYNAAFSSLQINRFDQASELASAFLNRFGSDELAPDVRFIVAESQLMQGKPEDAVASYQKLLADAPADNPQRPLWVLRAATALNATRAWDETTKLLHSESAGFEQPTQRAEAEFLLGQAALMDGKPQPAAVAFARAVDAAPRWARAAEARLLRGTALLSAGDADAARKAWQELIDSDPATPMADQARYKLGQQAAQSGDHAAAIKAYDEIVGAGRDWGLIPYALYQRGWSSMQSEQHADAVKSFDRLLDEYASHALADDALIARGISYRTLGRLDQARQDLETYLQTGPTGVNLGHALYESALVDQQQKRFDDAINKLARIRTEVPDYAATDKVLYELGWSLREVDRDGDAVEPFETLLRDFPENEYVSEAAYFIGQRNYDSQDWDAAAKHFRIAADAAGDDSLREKSLYRLGWSLYKAERYDESGQAFSQQVDQFPDSSLAIDGQMMVGECAFKKEEYQQALQAYARGRESIRSKNETAQSVRQPADRQVRELILLHGGQSAAQLERWDEAIGWYEELKTRFPSTAYLAQLFYETGFALQQKGDQTEALQYFSQVAERYLRREIGARARFMMGEIYFGAKQFDKAIPEFQRVMLGFGAEQASDEIKNWQAKSGFEAGRCSEQLMSSARTRDAKERSRTFATQFYQYVVAKHPEHELATKATERLEALKRP